MNLKSRIYSSCNILHVRLLRLRSACRFAGRAIFCTGGCCGYALPVALRVVQCFARVVIAGTPSPSPCRSCNILHVRLLRLRSACRFVSRAIFCTGSCCGYALLIDLRVVQYFARTVAAVALCSSTYKSCNILHGRLQRLHSAHRLICRAIFCTDSCGYALLVAL